MEYFAQPELKIILAATAAIISLFNLIYYLRSVFYGTTKPHVYSWVIWGTVTAIAATVQYMEGAGIGTYLTAFVAVACYIRAVVGIHYGEKNITQGDKICLVLCFIGIILWVLMDEPLLAVMMVTAVDLGGFYPTIRKSLQKPHEENALSYALFSFTYSLGFLAIEKYSFETCFYTVAMIIANAAFAVFLVTTRQAQKMITKNV